ncbi:hypothetical protein VRU48_08730 [Pedobacter sp. KR3-3]|uniref:VCBS repeat-containing protein n=1 Tax=Pedobacter albus TaxID=3113905 RepID=A0ABU7I6U4_9SPHI|nr:hypothetical protein [Pedobacter sp. KR3-3]MEE1945190.1 hypothetical protein [Pedobacter sp. KR3-3]
MKLKNQILLLCLVFLLSCRQKSVVLPPLSQADKASKTTDTSKKLPTTLVETITDDLNHDGKMDEILVWTSDTTGFDKVDIKIEGLATKSFEKEDGYADIDTIFLKNNSNSIKSKRVFVYKKGEKSIVMLFTPVRDGGYDGPTLISITKNTINVNVPKEVEIPIRIFDLNKDGVVDFIGTNWGEMESVVDSLDANIGSYRPYFVYSLADGCKIDLKLTEQYNKEHYVWAGLTNTQNIRVLYPRNGGKPKIVK